MASTRKSSVKQKSRKTAKQSKSRKAPAKSKQTTSPTASPKALRLTFSFDGDNVKLVSQQTVEMVVPTSDPVKGFSKQEGFWAELKTEQNKTLYRRVMHNPTRTDAEVFSGGPDQNISRAPTPKRKGVFVVVVPDTEKGDAVTLSRSSAPTTGPKRGLRSLATQPATEFVRIKLKK
jgi:hypothetical protein